MIFKNGTFRNKDIWIWFLAIVLAFTLAFATIKNFRDANLVNRANEVLEDYKTISFQLDVATINNKELTKRNAELEFTVMGENRELEIENVLYKDRYEMYRSSLVSVVKFCLLLEDIMDVNGVTYPEYGIDLPLDLYEINDANWK